MKKTNLEKAILNPKLNKYQDKVLFPDQVAKANAILKDVA